MGWKTRRKKRGGRITQTEASSASPRGRKSRIGTLDLQEPLLTHLFSTQSNITRDKDEAQRIIEAHQERIQSGEISLGDLAVTESDCSSARKRGDLGYFGKGDMQKEFEEAAFALQPGEISGVVDTASGLHLIERLE